MVRTSTPWLTAFATLGLAAASASTWVHYKILNDPTYASFCDVNSTLNCTDAYTSRFGAFGGVPVALFGLLFFAGVLGLIALCSPSKAAAANLPGYVFAASTLGLAVVLYLAYASYFVLGVVCLLCVGTYVAVIGLFLISGAATKVPLTSLPMRIIDDLKLLVRTPSALSAAVVFVAAAAGAIAVFPEQPVTAAAGSSEETQAAGRADRVGRAASAARAMARRSNRACPVMAPSDGAAIVILKFNDYQCPGCGQTYRDYKPVLAKWAKQSPGKVKFITKDYPLERQCNAVRRTGPAPVAPVKRRSPCDSRARRARPRRWKSGCIANQPAMNPDTVKKAAASRRRRHRL